MKNCRQSPHCFAPHLHKFHFISTFFFNATNPDLASFWFTSCFSERLVHECGCPSFVNASLFVTADHKSNGLLQKSVTQKLLAPSKDHFSGAADMTERVPGLLVILLLISNTSFQTSKHINHTVKWCKL